MAVLLPSTPGPVSATLGYLDWGGVLRSPLGGADQKLNRLGDRFTIDVTMPPLPTPEEGAAWVAALIKGQKEGVLFPWPQPIEVDGAGALAVDGAGQAGTTLNADGATSGRKFLPGQVVSVMGGGRRYMHMIMGAATANGLGKVALSIEPMMRVIFADNAAIEVDQPLIEGFLEDNRREWTLDTAMNVGLQFRLTEAE